MTNSEEMQLLCNQFTAGQPVSLEALARQKEAGNLQEGHSRNVGYFAACAACRKTVNIHPGEPFQPPADCLNG